MTSEENVIMCANNLLQTRKYFASCKELLFKGKYDPQLSYSVGDICILDGETCVFDGEGFQELGNTSSSSYEPPKRMVYGTCQYCGAPLKDEECEYCGVRNLFQHNKSK